LASLLERRLVATLRASGDDAPRRSFLERAHALVAGLAPVGAVHVGWDALSVTFAFEPSHVAEVLGAARGATRAEEDESPWAIGLAYGDLGTVAGAGSELLSSGLLWWGPPLVSASALATRAEAGETLCAESVPSSVRAVVDGIAEEGLTDPLPLSEEPDSMIEHARIIGPGVHALIAAFDAPADSEPTTLVDEPPAGAHEDAATGRGRLA
jgi:hypothetical protein